VVLGKQDILDRNYTCDFYAGKPVVVGTLDKWVPASDRYQRMVEPILAVTTSYSKVRSTAQNLLQALDKLEEDAEELHFPKSSRYHGIGKGCGEEDVCLVAL
jgi:hypothetical protein